jgi:hypothetical protein
MVDFGNQHFNCEQYDKYHNFEDEDKDLKQLNIVTIKVAYHAYVACQCYKK